MSRRAPLRSDLTAVFESADDDKGWARAERALGDAIRGASDVAALRAVVTAPVVSDAYVGEADGGEAAIDPLMERARAAEDAEAAMALSWAVRACAFDPFAFLSPEAAKAKPRSVTALRVHERVLAAYLASASPERRSAAAIALCWCSGPGLGELLLPTPETNTQARASRFLLLAARATSASEAERQGLAQEVGGVGRKGS